MASVYSTQFALMHGGASVVYTVPAGYIAVIRSVTAFNASPVVPEDGHVYLGDSSVTIYQRTLSTFLPSSPGYYDAQELRVVVDAGDRIHVEGGPDVDVSVSGYLLSLP